MSTKTPLYDEHVSLKAKMVDFHGFVLPVLYGSIKEEHNHVRTKSGIFDISHMGQILIEGRDAFDFIQFLSTNDASHFKNGQAFYTLLCKENGGIIDDLIILKYNDDKYFLVVNASNIEKDYSWIKKHAEKFSSVKVKNLSDSLGMLALQGPLAYEILNETLGGGKTLPSHFYFSEIDFCSEPVIVSGTGYTGEDGFEIIASADRTVEIWKAVLETAKSNVMPCGLGARDTLRIEASYMLYGNDIDEDHTPVEAGIGWAVKKKGDTGYLGKKILSEQKNNGVKRKLVGFKTLKPGIPRHGNTIVSEDGKEAGKVTSATYGPYIKKTIGMGYVIPDLSEPGSSFIINNNSRKIRAEVVRLPFYKR
ncbi:MAG: glycine cleavage system aminomethyltransferase GcvT [Spirochaetes bacterium]|nr:glycine cleavage system aminomethyltransferase GcvT [Spirochaetota bacterium]